MQPPPAAPGGTQLFQPLLLALTQCVCVVACGYCMRRTRVFSPPNVEGISAFTARVALPALILLNVRAAWDGQRTIRTML